MFFFKFVVKLTSFHFFLCPPPVTMSIYGRSYQHERDDDLDYIHTRFQPSGAISITEALSQGGRLSKPLEPTVPDENIQIPSTLNPMKTNIQPVVMQTLAKPVPIANPPITAPLPQPLQSTIPSQPQPLSSVFPTIAQYTQHSPRKPAFSTAAASISSATYAPSSIAKPAAAPVAAPLVPRAPPAVPVRPTQLLPVSLPPAPAPATLYEHVDSLRDTPAPAHAARIWAESLPPGHSALTLAAPTAQPAPGRGLFGNLHTFLRGQVRAERGGPADTTAAALSAQEPSPQQAHARARAEALQAVSAGVSWERAALASTRKVLPHPRQPTAPATGYVLQLEEVRGLRLPAALAEALQRGDVRAEQLHWRAQMSW